MYPKNSTPKPPGAARPPFLPRDEILRAAVDRVLGMPETWPSGAPTEADLDQALTTARTAVILALAARELMPAAAIVAARHAWNMQANPADIVGWAKAVSVGLQLMTEVYGQEFVEAFLDEFDRAVPLSLFDLPDPKGGSETQPDPPVDFDPPKR